MNKIFLTEERNRLNLKAKDVAEFVGVAIPTQSNYENGKRSPDAEYLAKLTELGFDINYVLTGKRESLSLATQEKMLIELFRQAPETVQRHILAGLLTQNTPEPPKGNIVTVGDSNTGNVAGRDITLK
ncbi:helix-turn-helix transcriptional regulator [Acinetobacter ursingii]|jgi:transcriptional regulator with XRE-family HTH domain|uniref:helix-turn-helix domain-containing protein n=1 Tax=Acinetobacter TaxID=469 RepID=UPI00109CBE52|nr:MULTISPECIES: helix-turn-helix transcriptional regulator [Acinetobacter]MDD4853711.1 helix-turn-helix transcriptional regulator [Acinetobacter towneri]MCD0189002.1 helix-turn-helix transcriptional regulator [Acinetobacter sp. PW68]MCU4359323.1 helix-turn-helix transcriptional regulator [Acinetobacter ursingii]MDG9858792.1 helix-turn-helix transcriptional regulator [Acinetobacter ursingii]MDG9892517.1 helix-turn-helix transcriptional regulator [Acinetobacter ursingii]